MVVFAKGASEMELLGVWLEGSDVVSAVELPVTPNPVDPLDEVELFV